MSQLSAFAAAYQLARVNAENQFKGPEDRKSWQVLGSATEAANSFLHKFSLREVGICTVAKGPFAGRLVLDIPRVPDEWHPTPVLWVTNLRPSRLLEGMLEVVRNYNAAIHIISKHFPQAELLVEDPPVGSRSWDAMISAYADQQGITA